MPKSFPHVTLLSTLTPLIKKRSQFDEFSSIMLGIHYSISVSEAVIVRVPVSAIVTEPVYVDG